MKILVTGVTGQVGWELVRSLQPLGEVVGLSSRQLDLADADAIRSMLRAVEPDLIVNPAAYTAVDKAESEPDVAMRINGVAPGILAEEARRLNACLIHYSTDYVFDGSQTRPYREDDAPNPINEYGRSKLAGERAIAAVGGDWLVLRTSWVYAARGKNFLRTILRLAQDRESLAIVADQIGAPTWARQIADATGLIVGRMTDERRDGRFSSGIFNLASAGQTTWHGFASAMVDEARLKLPAGQIKTTKIDPIPTSAYPLPATRPLYSLMSSEALIRRFGIELSDWRTGASLCLADLLDASFPR